MDVAHEGQSLAAALNHSTLNIANALGAWLGGVVLSAGSATSGPAGSVRSSPSPGSASRPGRRWWVGGSARGRSERTVLLGGLRRLPCADGVGGKAPRGGTRGA